MARMVTIDKGIDIPNPQKGRPGKYPWKLLEPGDSFVIKSKRAKNYRGGVYAHALRYGIKVKTRLEKGGVRVWRVDGMKAKKR